MPLRGLTEEQRDVVTFNGDLLLTACPGAGKTKTLVSRLAHILEGEMIRASKRRVIAITFTNIAAETILERIDSYGIESKNLWVGTIHAFCLEWIIKPYQGYCGRISKGFRIIDEYEQRKLITDIKGKFSIGIFDHLPTRLSNTFNILASADSKEYGAAYDYHETLKSNHWIDFDLILTVSANLIIEHPDISKRLAKLFSVIMVDEYQDTNQNQYDILAAILRHSQTQITLIGDVDQAIYTGLGAVVKNAQEIQQEFSLVSITEKSLSGCFRSTQTIIDFYKNFQDKQINIQSFATLDKDETGVFIDSDVHRDDLGEYVAGIIDKHLKSGIHPSEIVVLAPQWMDAIRLGSALREARPNLDFSAPSISPIPKSQDSPWINLIRLYFTPVSAKNYSRRRRLSSEVSEDLISLGFSLDDFSDPEKKILKAVNVISPKLDGQVEEFIDSFVSLFAKALDLRIEDNAAAIEAKGGLIKATSERISQFSIVNQASSLPAFFSKSGGINVTSCHSTKGDEYDVVIAVGLVKGKLPHWNDIMGHSSMHTDYVARRLLYVISSRARNFLYLISEQGHTTRKGLPLTPTPQLLAVLP